MEQYERFNRIYDETRNDMLRYILIRTNADPEAEDLMQEVYRKFYIRLSRNMLPILNPRRYLFSIAKKELSRFYLRAGQRKLEQPIEELNDTIVSDDSPLDERLLVEERKDIVWHLLQNEPELNRRIFYLFYGCNRSQKAIAKAFGLDEAIVRQRLYRIRQRIRTVLEAEQDAF